MASKSTDLRWVQCQVACAVLLRVFGCLLPFTLSNHFLSPPLSEDHRGELSSAGTHHLVITLFFKSYKLISNRRHGLCAPASPTAMDNIRDEILGVSGRRDSGTNKASNPLERSVSNRITDATGPPLSRAGSQDSILARLGIFDETLDPSNPGFDFERWARTIVDMRARLGLPAPARSGVVFKKLVVHGSSLAVKEQDTVWKMLAAPFSLRRLFQKKQVKTILHGIDGIVQKGELLLVLGRPGSGCSTFLKTITGKMDALKMDSQSVVSYRGIVSYIILDAPKTNTQLGVPHEIMTKRFRGELVYNEEVDKHFPYLTVGETLEFAAAMRTPRARLPGVTRADRRKHVVSVVLAIFGLSHTRNTIVGDDYVRGVSGGERKRVSIAETALSEAALTAWDNSTRGLDAESALNFVGRLRTLSDRGFPPPLLPGSGGFWLTLDSNAILERNGDLPGIPGHRRSLRQGHGALRRQRNLLRSCEFGCSVLRANGLAPSCQANGWRLSHRRHQPGAERGEDEVRKCRSKDGRRLRRPLA